MLNAGNIEELTSEWASPIVLVRKKDKSLRICVDYRKLNAVSQMEPYPMPRIEELLDRLGKASYLTTLDWLRVTGRFQLRSQRETKSPLQHPSGYTSLPGCHLG